jgi:hypothetical protein
VGRHTVYVAALLETAALALREALCRAHVGPAPELVLPSSELLYQRAPAKLDRALALCMGFVARGAWLIRCDVLERLATLAPDAALEEAKLMLGASEEEARALVGELPRPRKRRRKKSA